MLWPWRGAAKAKQATPERRVTTRLDKVFPVWLDGERGVGHGVARNISDGGLFVETSITHPIGTQVRVTFIAGDEEMTAVGEVRYVCALTGRGAGLAERYVGVRGLGIRFLYFESARPEAPTGRQLH